MPRLLALFSALLISLAAFAHAYHASIMEVKLNPKTQQLEVALKVFTDDLEKALSEGQPRPVSLSGGAQAEAAAKPLVGAYLQHSVTFGTKPGEKLPLTYLGMEREKDAHWLYFAVKLPRPVQQLTLRHRLFLEQFSDQMNIVNLEAGGKKQSALFRGGNEEQQLSW